MTLSTWKARASALGGYAACLERAATDRAIAEGRLERPELSGTNSYADLGTVIHWFAQMAANVEFPNDDPAAALYTEAEAVSALDAFRGGETLEELRAHAERVGQLVAQHLPEVEGRWYGEPEITSPYVSGHIDFLSRDKTILVDLKTTSRKPDRHTKMHHLWQQAGYAFLVPEVRTIYVLYADSQGNWIALSDPLHVRDENGVEIGDWIRNVRHLTHLLRTDALDEIAYPNYGSHCDDCFCPYRSECRDQHRSKIPRIIDTAPPPPEININIFGG